jgi:hypothetical protein
MQIQRATVSELSKEAREAFTENAEGKSSVSSYKGFTRSVRVPHIFSQIQPKPYRVVFVASPI